MKTNMVNKPTEEEIITILSNFNPRPSERFYQKMRSAPWQRVDHQKTTLFAAFTKQIQQRRWQPLALLATIILLIAILIISTPSARVVGIKACVKANITPFSLLISSIS